MRLQPKQACHESETWFPAEASQASGGIWSVTQASKFDSEIIFDAHLLLCSEFVDPPFIIEKVDYTTGNTKFADFDSDPVNDENLTPETTPR